MILLLYGALISPLAVQALYDESKPFKCGKFEIPFSAINDDFCDCIDGSDEPGTSACQNGHFYCKNKGHVGVSILSSRVNDGICDHECCDGTDEPKGKCPNTCAKKAQEIAAATEKMRKIQNDGSIKKQRLILNGEKNSNERKLKIKNLEASLNEVTPREASLKAIKESAEKLEEERKAKNEKRQKTTCAGRYQELLNQYQNLRSKHDELINKLHEIMNKVVDQNGGILPLKPANDPEERESNGVNYEELANELIYLKNGYQVGSPEPLPFELLRVPLEYDPCNDEGTIFNCASHTSKLITKKVFSNKKLSLYITHLFSSPSDVELSEDPERARKEHSKILEKKEGLEKELAELKKNDGFDTGPLKEWEKYLEKSNSFKITEMEYGYEISLFGKIMQDFPNDPGATKVHIGTFSRWGNRAGENAYKSMMFENGQQCYNGPVRSAQVDFECGAEEKILSVSEPNKCEYYFVVRTPAICPTLQDEHSEL